jgi:hypothetical protein
MHYNTTTQTWTNVIHRLQLLLFKTHTHTDGLSHRKTTDLFLKRRCTFTCSQRPIRDKQILPQTSQDHPPLLVFTIAFLLGRLAHRACRRFSSNSLTAVGCHTVSGWLWDCPWNAWLVHSAVVVQPLAAHTCLVILSGIRTTWPPTKLRLYKHGFDAWDIADVEDFNVSLAILPLDTGDAAQTAHVRLVELTYLGTGSTSHSHRAMR